MTKVLSLPGISTVIKGKEKPLWAFGKWRPSDVLLSFLVCKMPYTWRPLCSLQTQHNKSMIYYCVNFPGSVMDHTSHIGSLRKYNDWQSLTDLRHSAQKSLPSRDTGWLRVASSKVNRGEMFAPLASHSLKAFYKKLQITENLIKDTSFSKWGSLTFFLEHSGDSDWQSQGSKHTSNTMTSRYSLPIERKVA